MSGEQAQAAGAVSADQQAAFLRLAGKWGLMRDLGGRSFMLTGMLSADWQSMQVLITAAGGRLPMDGSLDAGTVDVLVTGEGASDHVVIKAHRLGVQVWDEQDLVLALVPTLGSLLARPGEAPF